MLLTNNKKLVKYNTEDYILKYKRREKNEPKKSFIKHCCFNCDNDS